MLAKYGTYRTLGKQCPFCGRMDTLEFAHRGNVLAVECAVIRGGCGARGPEVRKHGEAVKLWNRRETDAEGTDNVGSARGTDSA